MTRNGRRGVERLRNAKVAVWGTGAEGRAMAELARSVGATVTVVDDRVHDGIGSVKAPRILGEQRFDVVVRSPGVSTYRPELQAARSDGALVTTATSLWLEDFGDGPVVAVTGSKGKSTTAALAAAALQAAGRRVVLAGNMGRPLAELYEPGLPAVDAYVIEVSSYQAADVMASPLVGVLTLLAPDHLDWHGGYDRYVADKLRLFAYRPSMTVAVNATDPEAWRATGHLIGRVGYGTPDARVAIQQGDGGTPSASEPVDSAGGGLRGGPALFVTVDGVSYAGEDFLRHSGLALRGRHNLVNLCGALTATAALVGEVPGSDALHDALRQAAPLGSRLVTVASTSSLEFVDDALASNPAGAVAALAAFAGRRVALLAGGADRGVSFDPLVEQLTTMVPAPAVVVLGPAGARLARALAAPETPSSRSDPAPADARFATTVGAGVQVVTARTVPEAVERAVALLDGRGVVLFSPAAPTPEHEGTYLDRSAAFTAAASTYARRQAGEPVGLEPTVLGGGRRRGVPPC